MATVLNQPTIAICVASHISYTNQLQLLDCCLDSLISQTMPATSIILSISFSNTQYKKYFFDLLFFLFKYGNKVQFIYSKKRKSQMEHIYHVFPLIKQYDLVMFIDDDDTYHEDRVQIFSDEYKHGIAQCPKHKKFAGVRDYTNQHPYQSTKDILKKAPEIWGHGLVPSIIEMFFTRCKGHFQLLTHNLADMYFRSYLCKLNQSYVFSSVLQTPTERTVYYRYNEQNPHSICAQLEKAEKNLNNRNIETISESVNFIHDQLLLATIIMDDSRFSAAKQFYCISDESTLNKIFPERQNVLNLCQKLYDLN
eukprot:490367_1